MSAGLLSNHFIMPLIGVSHLLFSSSEPLKEASGADLEKVRYCPIPRPEGSQSRFTGSGQGENDAPP